MDFAAAIRDARHRAGLTQAELAELSATSQTTLCAYEGGHKVPNAATLGRVLAAGGVRLATGPATRPVHAPTAQALERSARRLAAVIELAAALPTSHRPTLAYPRLPDRSGGPL